MDRHLCSVRHVDFSLDFHLFLKLLAAVSLADRGGLRPQRALSLACLCFLPIPAQLLRSVIAISLVLGCPEMAM